MSEFSQKLKEERQRKNELKRKHDFFELYKKTEEEKTI